MSSVRILIVEDDADHGRSLQEAISDLGYEVEVAATGEAGIEAFRARGADVVLTDLVLPDVDGIAVMQRIRALGAAPVILMTAYASIDTSVRAIREGAYDYLQKPLDIDELQTKLERALEAARLRRQVEQLSAEVRGKWSAHGWVAESPVMREVVRQTLALADTNATVLIRGASGTGKELVARALHADGPRANGPFVAVNCAAFAESLLESELFGHEKGSFTGAVTRRAGAFERAEGGTLFLDEIGDAPPAVQVKLLRVLEDREIMRVGGQKSFRVDVRLVSATNRDLDERVASGKFRQDLLYRLAVVSIVCRPCASGGRTFVRWRNGLSHRRKRSMGGGFARWSRSGLRVWRLMTGPATFANCATRLRRRWSPRRMKFCRRSGWRWAGWRLRRRRVRPRAR